MAPQRAKIAPPAASPPSEETNVANPEAPLSRAGIWLTRIVILLVLIAVAAYFLVLRG